jgi:hypothetical protein
MEIDSLQSDLTIFLSLHMQAVCYSIVFSEDRTAQRHTLESWNRMGLVIDGQIVLILCPHLHLVEPDFAFARISCYIGQQLQYLCRPQGCIEQEPCPCITSTFKAYFVNLYCCKGNICNVPVGCQVIIDSGL